MHALNHRDHPTTELLPLPSYIKRIRDCTPAFLLREAENILSTATPLASLLPEAAASRVHISSLQTSISPQYTPPAESAAPLWRFREVPRIP